MHETDHEGAQPFIQRNPSERGSVEPRQRRVLLGVSVRTGVVTVRVPVRVVAMCMQVFMKIERMFAVGADMGVGCADSAPDSSQGKNAKQDQHHADREFHGQTEPWRDDNPEYDDRRTNGHDRDSVSDAPSGANQRRTRYAALAADDRRNGDHVIGVGRMPHPEEKAKK
jgi:hypothetical protein